MTLRDRLELRRPHYWITLLERSPSEPGYLLAAQPLRVYVGKPTDRENAHCDYSSYDEMGTDGWTVVE